MRNIFSAIVVVLVPVLAMAQPLPPEAEAPEPQTIVRTYNISDLVRASRNYPLDSLIEPPTGLGSGFGWIGADPGGGIFMGMEAESPTQPPDRLAQLITDTVDAENWVENGGMLGQIRSWGTLLVITQTKENHERIQQLLDEIRKHVDPSQIVAIRAVWVQLPNGDAPSPAAVVGDEWLQKQKIYCEARTVCFSGQTVHLTSGRGRTVVRDLTPVVGDSSAAFDPDAALVQSGVSLQVAPQLVPGVEAAILDVHSYASEWSDTGTAAPVTAVAATHPQGEGRALNAVDRVNVLAQTMKTTLRVPLERNVVIGGMTFDPADEQRGTQLCLIVRVTAVR